MGFTAQIAVKSSVKFRGGVFADVGLLGLVERGVVNESLSSQNVKERSIELG